MQQNHPNFHPNRHFRQTRNNDFVTNRQADFDWRNDFNNPAGMQRNQYFNQQKNDEMQRRHFETEHYRNHLLRNMNSYRPTEHPQQEWNDLVNRADNMQNNNNMRNFPNRQQNQIGGNFGETFNPQNRHYNPMFADDELGFSGNYGNDYRGDDFYNNRGFYRDNFSDMSQGHHPSENQFRSNEWQNRGSHFSQDKGGFFGH